jgi:hypothetical protein
LGASALAHLFVFFTLSQFNLLQTKACDSPYVGKVCQVLDAAYLGSVFLGTDPNFVSEDYEKTEIADADITYIDVSRVEPPLKYPEGYFALANPESAMNQTTIPDMSSGFTPGSPSELDFNAPQILPTPNNNVTNQSLPDSPFSFGDDSTPAVTPNKTSRVPSYNPPRNRNPVKKQPKIKNDSPANLPDLDGNKVAANNSNSNTNQVAKNNSNDANKSTDGAEDDQNKLFNQKPLKDFGTKYGEQILSKNININAPFTIDVIAKLDKDGKLLNAKMQTADGSDPQMTEVAKAAISAFSDSRLLQTLYNVVVEEKDKNKNKSVDVKITFSQNKDNLQVIIQTQANTEERAKSISSGLNTILAIVKNTRKGSDEATLMEKAQLATQGKVFIINFLISNDEKNQMIEKSLKNLKDELEKKTQPNSVAVNKDKNAKV